MARTRKCDECRKDCVKSTMFVVEDFDRNYNVKINYYCNEECSKAKEKRKKLIKEINDLFEYILEMPVRTNMYFNKLYKDILNHYGYDVIYSFLYNEQNELCMLLNKEFNTPNVKIKYFFAIMQNNIDKYKEVVERETIVESKVEDVYEIKNRGNARKQKKRSIFDI